MLRHKRETDKPKKMDDFFGKVVYLFAISIDGSLKVVQVML